MESKCLWGANAVAVAVNMILNPEVVLIGLFAGAVLGKYGADRYFYNLQHGSIPKIPTPCGPDQMERIQEESKRQTPIIRAHAIQSLMTCTPGYFVLGLSLAAIIAVNQVAIPLLVIKVVAGFSALAFGLTLPPLMRLDRLEEMAQKLPEGSVERNLIENAVL